MRDFVGKVWSLEVEGFYRPTGWCVLTETPFHFFRLKCPFVERGDLSPDWGIPSQLAVGIFKIVMLIPALLPTIKSVRTPLNT